MCLIKTYCFNIYHLQHRSYHTPLHYSNSITYSKFLIPLFFSRDDRRRSVEIQFSILGFPSYDPAGIPGHLRFDHHYHMRETLRRLYLRQIPESSQDGREDGDSYWMYQRYWEGDCKGTGESRSKSHNGVPECGSRGKD